MIWRPVPGPHLRALPLAIVLGALAVGLAAETVLAQEQEIGRIKTVKGTVHVERGGQRTPAAVGAGLRGADQVLTGPDGAVGITLADETLLSAGPNSVLGLDRFAFDARTQRGSIEASLTRGTLAVVSGRIAKQAPDAMTIRTPTAVLGVRGTEFLVRASDGAP